MRSQEKVCATLFGVWMRTLDELFVREGAGEARGGQRGETRLEAQASKRGKKKKKILFKQQKGKKRGG